MKLKSIVAFGLLATAVVAHAEDYPEVNLIGVNANKGTVATIETLLTDGKGDIEAKLKIIDQYEVLFEATTTEVWDEAAQGSGDSDVLKVATERLLKTNADKIAQYGIDLKNVPVAAFSHKRRNDEDSGWNYEFETAVKIKTDGPFYIFSIESEKDGYTKNGVDWMLKVTNLDDPEKVLRKHFIYHEKKEGEGDELERPANTGLQKIYVIKSKKGDLALVLSSYQTEGFEGPNTNFDQMLFNLSGED